MEENGGKRRKREEKGEKVRKERKWEDKCEKVRTKILVL